jgi:hypothetical protein
MTQDAEGVQADLVSAIQKAPLVEVNGGELEHISTVYKPEGQAIVIASAVLATDLLLSNLSINDGPLVTHTDEDGKYTTREMRRLTWREAYERAEDERRELSKYRAMWSDLDRCEHGRHEGDVCSTCGGPSHGNPRLADDRIVGFSLSAAPLVVPVLRAAPSPVGVPADTDTTP